MFNHSCNPSATCQTYADVMIIRSRKMIRAGEEIYISYGNPESPYQERQKALSKHFQCDCELCVADATEEKWRQERDKSLEGQNMIKILEMQKQPSPVNTKRIEGWFSSLQATYTSPRPSLRRDLIEPSSTLGHYYLTPDAENPSKATGYLMLSLECRGIVFKWVKKGKFSPAKVEIVEGSFDHFGVAVIRIFSLIVIFLKLSWMEEANAWAGVAFDLENISSGGGKALFFARYQKDLEQRPLNMLEFMQNHK